MALSVDIDRRPLDHHRTCRLDVDGRGFNRYAGLFKQDLTGPDLELDADVSGHRDGLLDVDRLILRYRDVLAAVLDVQLVVAILQRCVTRRPAAESFADGAGFRMADHQLIVSLGMDSDFL